MVQIGARHSKKKGEYETRVKRLEYMILRAESVNGTIVGILLIDNTRTFCRSRVSEQYE